LLACGFSPWPKAPPADAAMTNVTSQILMMSPVP
jgi:hypothetical protein